MKNIMEEVRKFLRTYPPLAEGKLVVASREFFGDKIRQQLDNLSFYGDFSEWLREQTMAGKLPNLGEGRKVMLMEATTSGYAMAAEASMARYQIQCRMEFFQTR